MRVGIALWLNSCGGKSDLQTYQEELGLAGLAEPLGFDTLWALEHHFTGYVMSPNPIELLCYLAGRTRRIELGTAVIVLPWHDPIRVAEGIALLDVLSGGRTVFGFGRGAATVEYEGFRVPMEEGRERFAEAAIVVRKVLAQERFSHHGKHFQIPETAIRPRPMSHPERRFYASTLSPESAAIMAEMGFGVMIAAQRDWEGAAADYHRYCEAARAHGHPTRPPIATLNVAVAEDPGEAREMARVYMGAAYESVDRHYHFADGHLTGVKGYEFYGKMSKTFTKLNSDPQAKAKVVDFYAKEIHVHGSPSQVLERLRYITQLVGGFSHLGFIFAYAGMPIEMAERNLRLFADKVLPILQRDPAFVIPDSPQESVSPRAPGAA